MKIAKIIKKLDPNEVAKTIGKVLKKKVKFSQHLFYIEGTKETVSIAKALKILQHEHNQICVYDFNEFNVLDKQLPRGDQIAYG